MQTIKVNIDYGFNDYLVLFELFDENPTEEPEDGSIIKKENKKGFLKPQRINQDGSQAMLPSRPEPRKYGYTPIIWEQFPHRTDNQRQKYQLQSKRLYCLAQRQDTGSDPRQ